MLKTGWTEIWHHNTEWCLRQINSQSSPCHFCHDWKMCTLCMCSSTKGARGPLQTWEIFTEYISYTIHFSLPAAPNSGLCFFHPERLLLSAWVPVLTVIMWNKPQTKMQDECGVFFEHFHSLQYHNPELLSAVQYFLSNYFITI